MNESDIAKPQDLYAALVGNAMHKREKLWRAAEGRWPFWVHVIGWAVGALLIFSGVYGGPSDERDSLVSIVAGLCLVFSAAHWRVQSQIAALRELLKLESSGNR